MGQETKLAAHCEAVRSDNNITYTIKMDRGSKRDASDLAVPLQAAKRAYLGDVNPGKEYVEPRIYQQPSYGGVAAGASSEASAVLRPKRRAMHPSLHVLLCSERSRSVVRCGR